MLACFNVHVSGGFSIFGNTFNTTFRVSHRFVTPIKGYRVNNSFVPLTGFEFWWMCMARRYWMLQYRALPITPGLNVMLIGVGRRLQGTCWSVLIFFWRDIFEPYMSP